jgi:hypothetical protein
MVLEWIAYTSAVNTISQAVKIIKSKNEYINEHNLAEVLKAICNDANIKVRRIADEFIITFILPKATIIVIAAEGLDGLEIESVDIEFHNPDPVEEPEEEEVIVQ